MATPAARTRSSGISPTPQEAHPCHPQRSRRDGTTETLYGRDIHRANNRRHEPYERITYPLLDLGIRRTDCPRIIRSAGLPVPPKSACWFCPFHRLTTWQDMRRDQPDLFTKACHLENTINNRRATLGKDPVYLTRYNAPLADVTPDTDTLPFDEGDGTCDSGWCFT